MAPGPAIAAAIIRTCQNNPLLTGVICAGTKGAAADALSQRWLQQGEYKPERTVAFAGWNALYCGFVVYGLYSLLAPKYLPTQLVSGKYHPHAMRNTIFLCAFDNLIATPLLCLPLYYGVHALVEASRDERTRPLAVMSSGLQRYRDEAKSVVGLSLSFWVPIHLVTFSVVPSALRVHFTAACSFCTLGAMSWLQSGLEEARSTSDA